MTDSFYRYIDTPTEDGHVFVQLAVFPVTKKTAKGAWIESPLGRRFVLDAGRRKYAYPTRELALDSYRLRKEWQIHHCKQGILRAMRILSEINHPDFHLNWPHQEYINFYLSVDPKIEDAIDGILTR